MSETPPPPPPISPQEDVSAVGGVILDDFGALILKVVWMINYLYDTGRDYTPLGYWIRHQVVSTSS